MTRECPGTPASEPERRARSTPPSAGSTINIKSVKPHTNGEYFLVLGSGTQVKVSRSYGNIVARLSEDPATR